MIKSKDVKLSMHLDIHNLAIIILTSIIHMKVLLFCGDRPVLLMLSGTIEAESAKSLLKIGHQRINLSPVQRLYLIKLR